MARQASKIERKKVKDISLKGVKQVIGVNCRTGRMTSNEIKAREASLRVSRRGTTVIHLRARRQIDGNLRHKGPRKACGLESKRCGHCSQASIYCVCIQVWKSRVSSEARWLPR